jgi:hypothetical protein
MFFIYSSCNHLFDCPQITLINADYKNLNPCNVMARREAVIAKREAPKQCQRKRWLTEFAASASACLWQTPTFSFSLLPVHRSLLTICQAVIARREAPKQSRQGNPPAPF